MLKVSWSLFLSWSISSSLPVLLRGAPGWERSGMHHSKGVMKHPCSGLLEGITQPELLLGLPQCTGNNKLQNRINRLRNGDTVTTDIDLFS